MKGAQNYHKKVLYVMDNIQERSFFSKKSRPIELRFTEGRNQRSPEEPTATEQNEILEQLEEQGVIKLHNKEDELRKIQASVDKVPYFVIYNLVEIIQPNFNEHYETVNEKVKYSLEVNDDPITFNPITGGLNIFNIHVQLKYAGGPYLLCKALFRKPDKRWENDEIQEACGNNSDFGSKRRSSYYTCLILNKRIYKVTGIKDLVIYNNKTFMLNKKYSYQKSKSKV